MTMMMDHGLISLQRNGVIIKLIIDDANVNLAMVVPQRPHHNSGDQNTDECILLRKEDTQTDFSVQFFNWQPMSFHYTRVNRLFQLEMIFHCVLITYGMYSYQKEMIPSPCTEHRFSVSGIYS